MALNFVLSDFAKDLNASTSATLPGAAIPSLTSGGITAVYEMSTQVWRDTFQIHVDSEDIDNNTVTSAGNAGDIKYYVDNCHNLNVANSTTLNWPATNIINPSHAMCDYSGSSNTSYANNTAGSAHAANRMLVKHDYVRWLAFKLFGTAHGVDLFNNEAEVAEDLATQGANMWTQFIKYKLDYVNTKSTNTGMVADTKAVTVNTENYTTGNTVDANFATNDGFSSQNYPGGSGYTPGSSDAVTNICKVLFDQMASEGASRFQNIGNGGQAIYAPNTNDAAGNARSHTENYNGDGGYDRMPLPFRDGDTITFQITYNCASNQKDLTGISGLADADMDRIFNIKICLKDAAISNTTPNDSASYNASYVA